MSDGAARITKLLPERLDEQQRMLYEEIAGGRRAAGPQLFRLRDESGALEGPFNAFLLQPRLGQALQSLGSAVRYETTLSDRAREIAILVVAVQRDSSFEWYAHEAVGRHVGLTDAELDAIGHGDYDVFTDASERVVARTCHALLADGDLDSADYDQAVGVLGLPQFFEVLTLVGYYDALALQLRVFRVGAPDA